jgi:polysaccharide deacetylase 2 family uncharacterized protein YibQ
MVRHELSLCIAFVSISTNKRVILIIDDFGNRMQGTKQILDLPIPITVAVMPFMPTTHEDVHNRLINCSLSDGILLKFISRMV